MVEQPHTLADRPEAEHEARVALPNSLGLHARSAATLIKTAARFRSRTTLQVNGNQANARSLVELLRLGARQGHEIHVRTTGPDAEAALSEIVALMEAGFGEE